MRANKQLLMIWFWAAFLMAMHSTASRRCIAEPARPRVILYRLNFVRQTRAAQCAPPSGQA
jgi:hypothetical protein